MGKGRNRRRKGCGYLVKVATINAIYDRFAKSGLSNREIWLRYIWPKYGITERTVYNMLKASAAAEELPEGIKTPEIPDTPDLFNYDTWQDRENR